MQNICEQLSEYGRIEYDKSFSEMTTFRVGGIARYTIHPQNEFALQAIVDILNNHHIPYKVIGNGSNLLCSQKPYEGFVIRLGRTMSDCYFDSTTLSAMAGCSVIALTMKAMNRSLSGLEFASGIPGTVGGAVFMNAGAYKADFSQLIESVNVLIDGKMVEMSNEECRFAYRSSIFQSHPEWIIVSCRLKLKEGNREEIKKLMQSRQKRRMDTQPLDYPSAGSTFRNPENAYSWQMIDELGYRGKRIGGAMVSLKHSNFIINYNQATADDIRALIQDITAAVKTKFNVELKTEVEQFNWEK